VHRVLPGAFVVLVLACGRRDAGGEARGAAASASSVPSGGVRIDAAPAEGDVSERVRDAVARASSEGRHLVVYVGATWCEPCNRFHQAVSKGELDSTFPALTLLEFDLDRDRERLKEAGYSPKLIPLFALPAPDGRASGKQVEGGIKGEGAVSFIAPRLKALLAP
jgi:hypothetical protein